MNYFNQLSPADLALLATTLALLLGKDKTPIEMDVLGNFIVQIGCVLLTMSAQAVFLEESKNPPLQDQVNHLTEIINKIQEQISEC